MSKSAAAHVATPVKATIHMGDVASATASLLASLAPVEPELVLIFASPSATLPVLAAELRKGLPAACRIVGCSSAGELSGEGYSNGTAVAIGFPARSFRSEVLVLDELSRLPVSRWMTGLRDLVQRFRPDPGRRLFGILLVDGSAQQEEVLVATLDAALPHVMVMGGSAGDDLDFSQTFVIADQAVLRDVAIFCLIETDLEVRDLIFDHFRATDTRMIVTRANPAERSLLEINAEPAAEEYARIVGVPVGELSPLVFARHPLLVNMGGRYFVRAIRQQTEDGRLLLMSSIDTGAVMSLGLAEDLTEGFEAMLRNLPATPSLILSFDCILRRLAMEHAGLGGVIKDIFNRYNMAGFNTYGEQHGGMHMNQTFVGLAFLDPEGR
ncbi:FIST N-terminal domain-containing protein [Tabrizicola sp.]|uniref:FIST N-terminal domain-containing protein n=1 Tax=Tabrizicola sp. TaxID=2005166 RepID=UPI0035B4C18F